MSCSGTTLTHGDQGVRVVADILRDIQECDDNVSFVCPLWRALPISDAAWHRLGRPEPALLDRPVAFRTIGRSLCRPTKYGVTHRAIEK